MENPHDRLIHQLLSSPTTAAAHFQQTLPPALEPLVDWSTLRQCPTSFVDEALQPLHSDLLYEIQLQEGSAAYLYLLFEHQSRPVPLMAFRVLRYMVRVWGWWLDQNPQARSLPPVWPLVFYHGERAWNAPRRFHDLIAGSHELRAVLAPHQPAFSYQLHDLSAFTDDELKAKARVGLAWLLLKHAWDPDIWHNLPQWKDLFVAELSRPEGLRAVKALLRYAMSVCGVPPSKEVFAYIATHISPALREELVSYAQQLRTEGRQEELHKSRARMIALLQQKFHPLPPPAIQRVLAASSEQLDTWTACVFAAPTLDDLFERGH